MCVRCFEQCIVLSCEVRRVVSLIRFRNIILRLLEFRLIRDLIYFKVWVDMLSKILTHVLYYRSKVRVRVQKFLVLIEKIVQVDTVYLLQMIHHIIVMVGSITETVN